MEADAYLTPSKSTQPANPFYSLKSPFSPFPRIPHPQSSVDEHPKSPMMKSLLRMNSLSNLNNYQSPFYKDSPGDHYFYDPKSDVFYIVLEDLKLVPKDPFKWRMSLGANAPNVKGGIRRAQPTDGRARAGGQPYQVRLYLPQGRNL
jgi:hypothetical protein